MTALPGSLGDLVGRADGRPIYCLATAALRRELTAPIMRSFRHEFPNAVFINARARYRSRDDWRSRWPRERERYGAAIILTGPDELPKNTDRFEGVAGEHAISVWASIDIHHFAYSGRPIAWQAVVFPAAYWFSRFAVEPFTCMANSHYARLIPFNDTDAFCPAIFSWLSVEPSCG